MITIASLNGMFYGRLPFAEAIQNKKNHQAVEKELAQATKKIEQESEVSATTNEKFDEV